MLIGVTIATIPTRELGFMLASARQQGIDVMTLAMGDPRLKMQYPRQYAVKIWELRDWLKRALQRKLLKRDDMVVFTDAYDVLYKGDTNDIMNRWREAGAPDLLFSAERYCWPDKDKAGVFDDMFPTHEYKYLNSGTFMGTAGAMVDALNDSLFDANDDDQRLWTQYFLKHKNDPKRIAMDVDRRVFACMAGDKCLPLPDAPILHYNGSAKQCLNAGFDKLYPGLQTADPSTSLAETHGDTPSFVCKTWSPALIAVVVVAAVAVIVAIVSSVLLAKARRS